MTESGPHLRPVATDLVDGESNAVLLDAAYGLRRDEIQRGALDAIVERHGEGSLLLPLSARSGGGGVFQVRPRSGGPVVGLSLEPVAEPRVEMASEVDITTLPLDAIVIDRDDRRILAGAAITLDQLNHALFELLGPGYRVLGADLTSYTYAQVGATFMTGGMGPQRRYFSDSVTEIALFDGSRIRRIHGKDLRSHAGTYGWTGLVTAVCCRYLPVPGHEIAFALPVNGSGEDIGRLLGHLAPWCYLTETGDGLRNASAGSDLLLGVEHVTLASMQPMLSTGATNHIIQRARGLAGKCRAADCDGLVFINGFSDGEADEFLFALVDDAGAAEPTIAGVDLEFSEIFNDPEEMRAVREGIPYAARNQAPSGAHGFKGHTDATIRLDPGDPAGHMAALWAINQAYVHAMADFFDHDNKVDGQILVYGHLNPWGVDPHNRVTIASDDHVAFESAMAFIHEQTARFYRELDGLCRRGGGEFIGGEKGAGSEREILAAFSDIDNAPDGLVEKYRRQCRAITAASPRFNWRAMAPYAPHAG